MKYRYRFLPLFAAAIGFGILSQCSEYDAMEDYKMRFVDSSYYEGSQRPFSGKNSVVGFSHSNEKAHDNTPVDQLVTYKEVDAITRSAIQRSGGLEDVIVPGDEWVLIKPNLIEQPRRQTHIGTTTDLRVVKSLIQQILELPAEHIPKRITVGEGGGPWRGKAGFVYPYPEYDNMDFDSMLKEFGRKYPKVKFDWIDFNTESANNPFARDVPVPGGGLEFASYTIPRAILDADKFIVVSVMKTHEMVRTTMTHKNYIGITPSTVYGILGLGHLQLNHGGATVFDYRIEYDNAIDRTVNDLFSYHPADFSIVECFRCTEENGPREGWEIRRNLVMAAKDPLAIDAAGTYYMGMNPNDLDYLNWSYARGHGNTFDLNHIEVVGPHGKDLARPAIDKIKEESGLKDFVKHTLQPYQGRGIRSWLVNGPHSGNDIRKDLLEGQELTIRPAIGEVTADKPWRTYGAYNDYMDFANFFRGASSAMTYAYTVVYSETELDTELRFASDNGIRVILNGKEVYTNGDTGPFPKGRGVVWVEDSVPVTLQKGQNHLLVKVYNKSKAYGFSMYVSEKDGDTPIGVTYKIFPTEKKKTAVAQKGNLYWVDFLGSIHTADHLGGGKKLLRKGGAEVRRPDGIDVDPTEGKMYWTNMKGGSIYRSDLDGSSPELLIDSTHTKTPKQIRLDLEEGKMYWADRDDPKIMRANMDGSDPEVIVDRGLKSPVGVALDNTTGKVYFTDRYGNTIKRANKDGSHVETLVKNTVYPTDIAVDPTRRLMFWSSRKEGLIYRANLDGTNAYPIVRNLNEPVGITIDKVSGLLYYTEIGGLRGRILRSDIEGQGQLRINKGRTPLGLIFVPENRTL